MATIAGRSTVSGRDRFDLRILHEGWVEYYAVSHQAWHRYWMILTDKELQFYSISGSSNHKKLQGQLLIKSDTAVQLTSNSFGFEVTTPSAIGQNKHSFRFKNVNDRDLWRAYIIGLASGNVPNDVNLLPGQLRDVIYAIHNITTSLPHEPPQVPAVPRPNIELPPIPSASVLPKNTSTTHDGQQSTRDLPDDDEDDISTVNAYAVGDGRVSVRLYDGFAKVERDIGEDSVIEETVKVNETPANGLEQLMMHQSKLAFKTLDEERKPKRGHMLAPFMGHLQPSSSAAVNPVNLSRNQSHPVGITSRSASVRFFATEKTWTEKVQPHTTRVSSSSSRNNNEVHPFYTDPLKNQFPPPWFVECNRETAESVLLASRNHGNVLMRPSASSFLNGSYGITMRCDEPSGSRILHYAIHRTRSGFRIAVENEQPTMICLSQVMDFFIKVVGPMARPLTAVLGWDPRLRAPALPPVSSVPPALPSISSVPQPPAAYSAETAVTETSASDVNRSQSDEEDRLRQLHLEDNAASNSASASATAFVTSDQAAELTTLPPTSPKPWPIVTSAPTSIGNGTSSSSTQVPSAARHRVILNATVSGQRSPFLQYQPR